MIPPSANLVLWYAAASIALASDGSHVSRWRDQSPLVQDLVEGVPARQPLSAGALGGGVQTGPQGAGRWLVGNIADVNGAAFNTNNFTLYFLAQCLADGVLGERVMLGFSAASQIGRFEAPIGSGNITQTLNFPFPPDTQAFFASHVQQPILFCIVGDGTHQTLYANGVQVAQAASGSSSLVNIVLGSNGPVPSDTYATPNIFFEILGYNTPHSATTRRVVEAYFANKYGGGQIIFDGNSQFYGGHSTGLGTSIPGFTPHLVAAGKWFSYVNSGQNGITTPSLTARMATTAGLVNGLIAKRAIVMLEIENDLVANGASSNPNDTTYALTTGVQNLIDYSRAVRAYAPGTKLVLCTGLPIGTLIPPPANYEASRQAVNGWARSNEGVIDPQTGFPYIDKVADTGGPSSPIGTVASTANAALFDQADQQHVNDGGVANGAAPIIAKAVAAVLL